jgi:hypothetical protein
MSYDKIFRKRIIEYKDVRHTFKEVTEAFGVDSRRYYSWKKKLEEIGSLEYRSPKERRGKINKSELLLMPECYTGSMTGEHFERWFGFNLLNRIKAGRTIIMDLISFH